jgi:hypothetical protein
MAKNGGKSKMPKQNYNSYFNTPTWQNPEPGKSREKGQPLWTSPAYNNPKIPSLSSTFLYQAIQGRIVPQNAPLSQLNPAALPISELPKKKKNSDPFSSQSKKKKKSSI